MLREDKNKVALVKLDNTGSGLWIRTFASGSNMKQAGYSMTFSSDGFIYIVGTNRDMNIDTYQALLLKSDCRANEIWRIVLDDVPDSYGHAVSPTTDGGCYVAGFRERSDTVGNDDPLVFRVDREGNRLWTRILDNPEQDEAFYTVLTTRDGGCLTLGTTYKRYSRQRRYSSDMMKLVTPVG